MHCLTMGDAASFMPRVGVLAVVRRARSFLLVRRAKAPDAGLWGFPGGRVEAGETLLHAAARELHEETGLQARGTHNADIFESLHYAPDGTLTFHYVIIAVRCAEIDPGTQTLCAGDDALEARWFSYEDLLSLGPRASQRVAELATKILRDEA
ncbi:hydrolase [Acetobacter cibinongensis]|uniref:Hydrolase n=2 Tax=Acetobacter cibinongensis TaxID=146475 RepID=A0A1Z5YZ51_9PROT|nr:hydrolase [Acetobacter cibinongensis]